MNIRLFVSLVLSFHFSYTYENVRMTPRITQLNPGGFSIRLPREQPNAVFYMDTPDSLYIGGEEVLYHNYLGTWTNYLINQENGCDSEKKCKTLVTLVTRLTGNLYVCGTNTHRSACWKMDGGNLTKESSRWAAQLSPRYPGLSYNILNTGSEIYSTIPKPSNNAANSRMKTFQKINGSGTMRFTGVNLLKNPVYVKSLEVEGEQKTESRILLFFMDDNSERRTTDIRVPMIARMCKEERGSENTDERNMFSTALKSRLICGTQDGQYYNFLQDIYFLKSQSLVYGLFTNAWNHSAVCSYTIEDIEMVFNSSNLYESSKKDFKIRPGKCLSEQTPQETADEVFNHPELVDWVWPSGNHTVFQSSSCYTKMVVDEIKAVNKKLYRVIILATENGTLHKVVELEDGPLNVLEIKPFTKTGKILYLELDQNQTKHLLYVGTAYEFSKYPLDNCREYSQSCADCIASRDPFCGWIDEQCQSILTDRTKVIQNLTQGAMCIEWPEPEVQRVHHSIISNKNNPLPPSVYLLECPAASKQASYHWTYGDNHMESCTPHNGNCDLFLHSIEHPTDTEYKCVEVEYSRRRIVSEYTFPLENSSLRLKSGWILMAISVCLILHIYMIHVSNS